MQNEFTTISSILKPTPCSFVWKNILLTESYLSSENSYDLSSDVSLEKALAELSKEETFMSHLKVLETISTEDFTKDLYLKELGYGNISLINDIFAFSKTLPKEFNDWSLNKKLGPKDFRAFMNAYSKDIDFNNFIKLAELNPTKSNGLQILEYYFDLMATKKIDADFITTFKSPEKLLISLKKKRFANSLNKDNHISDMLSKIDLSKGVKVELKRIGDQRQLKLEIHSPSPEQLITHLNKTSQKIEDISKAWNADS